MIFQAYLPGHGADGLLSPEGGAGHHRVAHYGQQHGEDVPQLLYFPDRKWCRVLCIGLFPTNYGEQ